MGLRYQKLFAWSGVPMVVLWLAGWLIAGFLPPPSPSLAASDVVRMFDENRNSIRFGLILVSYASVLCIPFYTVVTMQMRRIDGPDSPLPLAQLALTTLLALEFLYPQYFLLVGALRPDRSPEILQSLYDLGWLFFFGVVSTIVIQFIIIAMSILGDTRTNPIFPRWFGWFTLWIGLLFCPGGFCVFALKGILAWNGLIPFWIPSGIYAMWMTVTTIQLLHAIRRQEQEGHSSRTENAPSELAAIRAELTDLRSALGRR